MRIAGTLSLLALFGGLLAAQAQKAPAKKGAAAKIETEWYQFRGPNRDGLSADTKLLKQWPKQGPGLAWKAAGIGAGFSSVSVAGGRIYTMGDLADGAMLFALNAADGKILWQLKVGAKGEPGGYPGPRSTPATDGTHVFALGQGGDLVCAEAATGKEVWRKSLGSDFGGRMMSGWGYSESPLLDGDFVVVTPGGSKGTVVALNKADGATKWQSKDLTDAAAYASLVPVTLGNVRQYLVYTGESVAGVVAESGEIAWKASRKGDTAVIPTPVMSKDGFVFVTSGYQVGHNGFLVSAAGGKFSAREVYSGKEMQSHVGGVVLVGDYVFGFSEGTLKCIEIKTGKTMWQDRSVGKGCVAYADGCLYLRSENGGVMGLALATPAKYTELGRFTQPDLSGRNTWAHPVIHGGRMYLRDMDKLFCYVVGPGK
jgi:outer membrane protein assembly factor BamB